MKKFITALLALALVAGVVCPVLNVFAVTKSTGISENGIIEIVGALEIMQGDQYGNLNLENKVTRAEFVKMAISASVHKDDSSVRPSYSLFPDVPASHWASGYIKTAVGSGYVTGYIDGTFRPSYKVKLEEAVNIVLKLLGYTASDFSGAWPSGQLAKYKSLKLDTGVSAKEGEELTRRDCMYLIYNTLCTETKSGTPYAKTLGYGVDANGNIDYTYLLNDKKEGPFVVNDASATVEEILKKGFIVYKDGKVVDVSEIKNRDVVYYADAFKTVWVYDDKTAGILEEISPNAKAPETITVSGTVYTLSKENSVRTGAFSEGQAVVVLLGENGEAAECYPAQDPYVTDNISSVYADGIFLNNAVAKAEDIKENSLVYLCNELSFAFAYDKTASGVVSDVLPSKQKPETVVVGGKSYSLCDNVKELFKNGKVLSKNDFVTLYLGSSDKAEYAEKADIYDTKIYKDNNLSYDALVAQTLEGPVIAKGNSWKTELGFSADEASYYRNGKKSQMDIIRDYDVLYYSETFKTVWVYSDRVTGVVEAIKPNAVTPSSVVVAGSEYALETSDAAIAFSAAGSCSEGETVTLLIGKDGVCAVESPENTFGEYLGISTDVSQKEYKGTDGKVYSDYYVTVASFDGRTHSVKTDNKNFETGKCVTVSYNNGAVSVKYLNTAYTDISKLKEAIKSQKISSDAVLVDTYKTGFAKTYAARLSEISIDKSDVIYYNINTDGYLDYLVLDDATGDMHSYGIIVTNGKGYKFFTGAKNNSISDYSVPALGGVGVKYSGGKSYEMETLKEIEITSVDGKIARRGGLSYKIWDYCEYYVMTQRSFSSADKDFSDMITACSSDYIATMFDDKNYTVRAYADKTNTVRVIVAQRDFGN